MFSFYIGKPELCSLLPVGKSRTYGTYDLVQRATHCTLSDGPGYRVYFTRRGRLVIVLLAGGDKSTQEADIERAIKMARNRKD